MVMIHFKSENNSDHDADSCERQLGGYGGGALPLSNFRPEEL